MMTKKDVIVQQCEEYLDLYSNIFFKKMIFVKVTGKNSAANYAV